MSVALGRRLYNLGRRAEAQQGPAWPARPPGRLVWLNLPEAIPAAGMVELARRLVTGDGVSVLLTTAPRLAGQVSAGQELGPGVIVAPVPDDTPAEARAFLDHWQPAAAVLAGGEIRPALVLEAAGRRLPLVMADARAPVLPRDRDGWYPGLMRGALGAFAAIFALDETAARALRKAGAPADVVRVAGRMDEREDALPCLEAEREALARLVAARPVWFAAAVPAAERELVLAAHRGALRLAHRLLLIVLPEPPDEAPALAAALEAAGWAVALRSDDQEPEPETEIYVVDSPAEIGLWYRLASVAFLGGSLAGQGAIRNPHEAAALGSAILHGPRAGAHAEVLGRLGAARGARAVASAMDLEAALSDLLSPDRAARLAHAAWAVSTAGAEVTEAVLVRLRELIGAGR